MKRLSMMSLTLALSFCIAPAWADDDEGKKRKKRKSSKPVVVSTIEVVDEDGDGDEKKTKSGTIVIDINGEKKEFKIGDQDSAESIAIKIDDLISGSQPKAIAVKIDDLIDKADLDKKIEALFIGQGMIVGPDGEKKEFKFGNSNATDTLKDLPEEVRIRVEKAMKGLGKDSMLGQAIMISPDGDKKIIRLGDNSKFDEVLKDLPEEARAKVEEALKGVGNLSMKASNGRAIVISPDGARNEFTFDGVAGEDVDFEVLKGLPGTLQYRIRKSVDGDKPTYSKAVATQDALSKKLDVILKRLDKIEQELKEMREE
ncbi:MAG: hypothetical protein AAGG48_15100 [Planctomycetota bacterium]